MINPKLLHNLTWIPPFLIGLCGALLGFLWLTVDEPWLLDRAANEAALQTTFTELFSKEINRSLPEYLTTVYRFFGLWILALGMMICAYVLITFMGTRRARNTLLVILGILLAALFYLEYTFIPISPFVILTYGLLVLYLVSLWASLQLNREEKR